MEGAAERDSNLVDETDKSWLNLRIIDALLVKSTPPGLRESPRVLVRRGRDGDAVGIEITDSMLRADDETGGFLGIGMLEDRPGRPAITERSTGKSQRLCKN